MIQEAVPQGPPPAPAPPGASLAQTNLEKAVQVLDAQMNGLRQQITELTQQLVPGQSAAREEVVRDQINSINDELETLRETQRQLVAGDGPFPGFREDRGNENPNVLPPDIRNLLESGMVFAAVIILGLPIVRMITRRFEPRPRADSSELHPRFERLEQGMDAVAIEVERISEGQRFTNKLLSDMKAIPAPNPMDQWAGAKRIEEKVERR